MESFIQSSVVSSVVVVGNKEARAPAGGPGDAIKARYLERVNDLDLEDLSCRQELMEVMRLKSLSHEDLSNHYCVDWLKAHETHFYRDKTLETADLTRIPRNSTMVAVNYRPLKKLGSPGLIVETRKHRTSIAGIRVAIPAQLKAVEKLLEPKSIRLPDTPTRVQNCQKTEIWDISWELTAGQDFGRIRSLRTWSSEGDHRGGNVCEVISAGDIGVPAAWPAAKSDADSNSGDEIGNDV